MKKRINELYLDYCNNFITPSGFAAYYEISEKKALRIISIGRKINHKG